MLFVPDWQTHRFPALVQRRRTHFGLQSPLHRPVHSSPCRTHQQGTGIRMAAKEVSATGSSGDTSSGLPGPGTSGMEVLEVPKVQGGLRVATVCAANMNRSMAAHALLQQEGFEVQSFGVGSRVKLPGASRTDPNVYQFGEATYESIYKDLEAKDEALYKRNGLLQMLQRNMAIKRAPQRWQDHRDEAFDLAITFEERVMEQLVEDMNSRPQVTMKPLLVLNIDVKDSHQEAANAAPLAVKLCKMIAESDDWESEIDDIVHRFEQETGRHPFYTICWY